MVVDQLGPMLGDLLGDISIRKTLTLPAPIGLTVDVGATLDQLTFCGTSIGLGSPAACGAHNNSPGAVILGLGGFMRPFGRHVSIPADARGPVQLPATTPTFATSSTSFGIGIKLDLINQALWTAWYAGLLHQPDLRAFLPVLPEGIEGSVHASLPPVLMPGSDGSLELGLGGLHVEGSVDVATLLGQGGGPNWIDLSMTLSAVVGASAGMDQARRTVSLALDDEPKFGMQVHAMGDHAYGPLLGERLCALLTEAMPALLKDLLAGIPLPQIDLSGVAGLPQGTTINIKQASAQVESGYVVLRGQL
jgi:hypothetical protein